jgi:hypothetical protein
MISRKKKEQVASRFHQSLSRQRKRMMFTCGRVPRLWRDGALKV